MAKQPEAKFKAMLVKAVLGTFSPAWHTYIDPSAIGRPGTPDLLFVVVGRHIWIEAKYGKNGLSAVQRRQHALLVRAGATVLVARVEQIPGRNEDADVLLRRAVPGVDPLPAYVDFDSIPWRTLAKGIPAGCPLHNLLQGASCSTTSPT